MKFLREDTKESAMRVSLFMVVVTVCFILACVGIYILMKARCDVEIANWSSMGMFVIGVAAIVTGMAWQKVRQKRIEKETKKEE